MEWKRAALILALCAPSCTGGGGEPRPVASLAGTADATVAFEEIRQAWDSHESRRPEVLRPLLERFLGRFPRDGRVPMARAIIALVAMDEDNWVAARALVLGLEDVPPGTTGNLATVCRARLLRHDKKPNEALEIMRPLVGKTVDPT